jgi:hypothetical protein
VYRDNVDVRQGRETTSDRLPALDTSRHDFHIRKIGGERVTHALDLILANHDGNVVAPGGERVQGPQVHGILADEGPYFVN